MTVLDMQPSALPPAAQALYETMAARRRAHGEHFGGPISRFSTTPSWRAASRSWTFSQVRGRAAAHDLPVHRAPVARATGAGFEWHDHIAHARAAGLPEDVIDCIDSGRTNALPQPYALAHAILTKTMAWQVVPDDLQAQAAAQWGKQGLVEIVVLSGFYQMFAAINQGFDIRPRMNNAARVPAATRDAIAVDPVAGRYSPIGNARK